MYILSYAVEVNPAGVLPQLTAEQVWAGLVLKAENALPFVPSMQRCDLVERHANGLRRAITVGGQDFVEDILFFPPCMVRFNRAGSEDFILNTISASATGLLLTFTFAISFPGVADRSPDEQARGDAVRDAYVAAVAATLAKVRDMVRAGEI